MLSMFELGAYAALLLLLLPMTLISLLTGSKPPPGRSLASKAYHADPGLMLVNNVFLLAMCAMTVPKLALHFGLIDLDLSERLEPWTNVPFLILLAYFVTRLIRAMLKVRRDAKAGQDRS